MWYLVRRGAHPTNRGKEPSQIRVMDPREKIVETKHYGKTHLHMQGHTILGVIALKTHLGLGFKLLCPEPSILVQTYTPSIQGVEAKGSEQQGQP